MKGKIMHAVNKITSYLVFVLIYQDEKGNETPGNSCTDFDEEPRSNALVQRSVYSLTGVASNINVTAMALTEQLSNLPSKLTKVPIRLLNAKDATLENIKCALQNEIELFVESTMGMYYRYLLLFLPSKFIS